MFRLRSALPALVATTAMAITACGSSPARPSGRSGPPTAAQIQRFQSAAIKLTDCMRTHGASNFPDPPAPNSPSSGRRWKSAFLNSSPGFRSALRACQHFIPGGGSHSQSSGPSRAQLSAMLAFARCIRRRGFPNFPDPNSSGITHQMLAAAGIDIHQPAVRQAADACVGVTHGFLTKLAVAKFIAGQ